MRVLFVTNGYPTEDNPGDSPCIAEQQKALEKLGHQVDVLFIRGRESSLNYFMALGPVIWNSGIRRRYDIVHAHYGYCGVMARAQFACPLVTTFRGSDVNYPRKRVISRLVARWSDDVIVMTEEMKDLLGDSDAHVIPYGIDLELFQPKPAEDARRGLGLPMDVPVVLFPYDPSRVLKRFDVVEKAVAALEADFPDVCLISVYDKPHSAVADYMNGCDVMVLASDTEGAPVAIREAMACNLPIVSVDVGDVAEVIKDTEQCYLASQNPEDIARKLALVLRTKRRSNGRDKVRDMGVAASAARVADLYSAVRLGASHAESRPLQPERLPGQGPWREGRDGR